MLQFINLYCVRDHIEWNVVYCHVENKPSYPVTLLIIQIHYLYYMVDVVGYGSIHSMVAFHEHTHARTQIVVNSSVNNGAPKGFIWWIFYISDVIYMNVSLSRYPQYYQT